MSTRKPVIFTHEIGAEPAPLTALDRLCADVDVVAASDNEDPVTISCELGEADLSPGDGCVFIGVDLATITVDGTSGDKLSVRGNTSA